MNILLVKPERQFILDKKMKRRLLILFRNDPKLKWWGFSETDLEQLPQKANNLEIFIFFLNIYKEKIKPDANIILFKAERLIHLFDRIIQAETKHDLIYLSIIRDCRGLFASQTVTKIPESGKWMSRNPVKTAIQWNLHVNKSLELERRGIVKLIKYEDLITNFNYNFFKILSSIGIPKFNPSQKTGDLFERMPETHKIIHSYIHLGPLQGKTKEWENILDIKTKMILEHISGTTLKKLGYKADNTIDLKGSRIIIEYYFFCINFYFSKFIKKIKGFIFKK